MTGFPLLEYGLVLGVALLVAGLAARASVRWVRAWRQLLWPLALTTAAAVTCLVIGVLAWLARDGARTIAAQPPLTSAAALAAAMGGGDVVVAGRVAEDDPFGNLVPAPAAAVERSGSSDDYDYTYRLNSVPLRLADGGIVTVDADTYAWDEMNWRVEELGTATRFYLVSGDWIVAYGRPYEGRVLTGEHAGPYAHLAARFLYRGTHDQFMAERGDLYRQTAERAHWLGVVALLAALPAWLGPLAAVPRLLRRR